MRTGSCKYGANCRFNHPDPTAAGAYEPPSGYGNGGSVPLQGASQSNMPSWSSPRALNEPTPFVPIMFSPTHVVPTPNPEWNGYQVFMMLSGTLIIDSGFQISLTRGTIGLVFV